MPRKWPVQLVSWNYKARCYRACSLSQCGRAGSCSVCKSQYPFRGAMSRPCLVPCLPAGSLHLSWASTRGEGLVDVDVDTPHGTASTTACICFLCGDMPRCSPDDSGGGAPGGQPGEETNLNERRIKLPVPPSCSAEYLCLGNMQLKVPSPTQTLAATSLPAWYFPPMSRGISRRQNGTAATDLD